MQRITAIEIQRNRPDRVNIHLDGEFAFGLGRPLAERLKVGQDLSEARISSLQQADADQRAYEQALLYLSFRPRSEAEIRKNLEKHQHAGTAIERILARLRSEGYADDASFARAWVDNRATFRPRGRQALSAELRLKGLDDNQVREAVTNVDEAALAQAAARNRSRRLTGLEWPEFRQKLTAYLRRRGFPFDIISRVVRDTWNELHSSSIDSAEKDES